MDAIQEASLTTRVAVLEAKVRVVVLALEGIVVVVASALLAFFFKGGT